MRILLLLVSLVITQNTFGYDYINRSSIMTKEESCKMYREFNLEECKKQAATVKDAYSRPNCEMWSRQREKALVDCAGQSERAKSEKKVINKVKTLRNKANHVLVDKGRLVCGREKSFRATYNSLINQEPGIPKYIRTKECKVLDYETIVRIKSVSDDGKVVDIEYLDKYGAARNGFTLKLWLVTKEKYKKILKARKTNQL